VRMNQPPPGFRRSKGKKVLVFMGLAVLMGAGGATAAIIVKKSGGKRGGVHAHIGKDVSDFQQMGEVGVA